MLVGWLGRELILGSGIIYRAYHNQRRKRFLVTWVDGRSDGMVLSSVDMDSDVLVRKFGGRLQGIRCRIWSFSHCPGVALVWPDCRR